MVNRDEFILNPKDMPKKLADLFTGFIPSGRRGEAIMRIATAWDQMTVEQRAEFFPKTSVSKKIWVNHGISL